MIKFIMVAAIIAVPAMYLVNIIDPIRCQISIEGYSVAFLSSLFALAIMSGYRSEGDY